MVKIADIKDNQKKDSKESKEMNFKDLPESLRKILLDLEKNFKIIKQINTGILFDKELEQKFEEDILSNYNDQEKNFLKFLFGLLSKNSYLQYISLRNHYNYHFAVEKKETTISTAEKKKKSKEVKTSGISEGSHPLSPNGERAGEGMKYRRVRDMPLVEVVGAIQGEIYKKGIYISKHCQEHFRTLSAKFNLMRNKKDIEIYDKLEKHLKPRYRDNKWAWPIDKEKQKKLGICFTMRMSKGGTITIYIKKRFKDIETFLEHYYNTFDFLSYEEHGRVLDLFYLEKEKRKVFDYIHLANKVGPKATIDEDFKGACIKVKYYTLKSGEKNLTVKIDYSDPEEPELEFEGPRAECENLRDILVKPAETLPTINNTYDMSLEARNNTKSILSNQQLLSQQQLDQGDTLQLLQDELLSKDDLYAEFSELGAWIWNLSLKEDIFQAENRTQFMSVKSHIKSVLEDLQNQKQNLAEVIVLIDKEFQELKPIIEDKLFDTTTEIINGLHSHIKHYNQNIESKFEEINTNLDSLKLYLEELISKEFTILRGDFRNNLYLVIREIHQIPSATAQQISTKLNLSKSTVYSYLKQLQDKKIIHYNLVPRKRPGRPLKSFFLTKKSKRLP